MFLGPYNIKLQDTQVSFTQADLNILKKVEKKLGGGKSKNFLLNVLKRKTKDLHSMKMQVKLLYF